MLSKDTLLSLKDYMPTIDLSLHKRDLDLMVGNIMSIECLRQNQRSTEQIIDHVASGLGAEIALTETGLFTSNNPIVANAFKSISYASLKSDLTCEGKKIEVKTYPSKNDRWYLSDKTKLSVLKSVPFNDFFVIMSQKKLDNLIYQYSPRYLVYSEAIEKYIKPSSGYSPWAFLNEHAVKRKYCIDFMELETNDASSE